MRTPTIPPARLSRYAATGGAGALLTGALFTGATSATAATTPLPASSPTAAAAVYAEHPATLQAKRAKLLIRYATKRTCVLYPNYRKKGTAWKISAGHSIIWRYNIDHKWAMVSDPHRAKRRHYPWWGVTLRGCIGKSIKQTGYPAGRPVPHRVLQARSRVAKSGWRRVIWKVPAGPIVRRNIAVRRNATLRDPANLVLGNVASHTKVHRTSTTRSKGFWVKVYVPKLHRYGYIEANKLR